MCVAALMTLAQVMLQASHCHSMLWHHTLRKAMQSVPGLRLSRDAVHHCTVLLKETSCTVCLPAWKCVPFTVKPALLHSTARLCARFSRRCAAVLVSMTVTFAGRSPTPLIDLQRHQIESLMGMGINNVQLYRTALTAQSAITPDAAIASSYDRLECLGDAVVGLVFRSWVFDRSEPCRTCRLRALGAMPVSHGTARP